MSLIANFPECFPFLETLLVLLDRERVLTLSILVPVGAGRGIGEVLVEGAVVVEGVGEALKRARGLGSRLIRRGDLGGFLTGQVSLLN